MNWSQPQVYAVIHKDATIREKSRSGGIFTALSDMVLEEGGVVYGCVLTEDFGAAHVRADSEEVRDKMRGSKYIQSKLGDTFRCVKEDLDAERRVLFTGTSCQIAGLRRFLGKEYENLLCVDIVCHGVPSTIVWKEYLKWQESRYAKKIVSVDFRNKKKFGWRAHIETLTLENEKEVDSRVFKFLFYGHTILRPSCYECPYKRLIHPGDITIADYWGIEKAAPEFDDNKGVSLVLINNNKGEGTFEKVKQELIWKITRIEDSLQPPLKGTFKKPADREQFWEDFRTKSFKYVAREYGGYGWIGMLKKVLIMLKQKVMKQ